MEILADERTVLLASGAEPNDYESVPAPGKEYQGLKMWPLRMPRHVNKIYSVFPF
jgi:hypothetical protein